MYIKLLTLSGFALLCAGAANAQVRSLNSPHLEWVTVPIGVKPDKTNVTIQTGNTITLDVAAKVTNLTISPNATLNAAIPASSGKPFSLQVGATDQSGIEAMVQNDGTLGSKNGDFDGIALEVPASAKHVSINGNGVYALGSLVVAEKNSSLLVDINQDMQLGNHGTALSASGNSATDNVTFNVMAGKTVTLTNAGSTMHANAGKAGGTYIYNVNGTLDMSAVTSTQHVGSGNTSLNVHGKLKLGSGFDASGAKTIVNIADGALVDAANTTELTMGDSYFVTNGTGALMRTVSNSPVLFPVAATGASAASGVFLKNAGQAGVFKVSVKNASATEVTDAKDLLNKQWTIASTNNNGVQLSVAPSWTTGDQVTKLDPSYSVLVTHYNGFGWDKTGAVMSGNGNSLSPYVATADGFNTTGVFGVAVNNTLSFTVFPNPTADMITVKHPVAAAGAHIFITGLYGKKMFDHVVNAGDKSTSADVSLLPKGVYMLQFDNNGTKYSAELIKN